MTSVIDLTQERIRDLCENTDFVSTLFESLIGYAIIAADFDGSIIAYNEGAHLIYGYAPEEIIGKQNIEIFFTKGFTEAGGLRAIVDNLMIIRSQRVFGPWPRIWDFSRPVPVMWWMSIAQI